MHHTKNLYISLIICILSITKSYCNDSLQLSTLENKPSKFRFTLNLDAKFSFINQQLVKLSGFKTGIEYKERYRAGVGLYFLSSRLKRDVRPERNAIKKVPAQMRFDYYAFYLEYVFYKKRKFELSIPLQYGRARLFSTFLDSMGHPKDSRIHHLNLLESYVTAQYKFKSWIGIGAGIGYRKVLSGDKNLDNNFDAPVFYAKIKFFPVAFYNEFLKRKPKPQKINSNNKNTL